MLDWRAQLWHGESQHYKVKNQQKELLLRRPNRDMYVVRLEWRGKPSASKNAKDAVWLVVVVWWKAKPSAAKIKQSPDRGSALCGQNQASP